MHGADSEVDKIKLFDYEGYRFDPRQSSPDRLVFTRAPGDIPPPVPPPAKESKRKDKNKDADTQSESKSKSESARVRTSAKADSVVVTTTSKPTPTTQTKKTATTAQKRKAVSEDEDVASTATKKKPEATSTRSKCPEDSAGGKGVTGVTDPRASSKKRKTATATSSSVTNQLAPSLVTAIREASGRVTRASSSASAPGRSRGARDVKE